MVVESVQTAYIGENKRIEITNRNTKTFIGSEELSADELAK
jgi:hypothetical protein